MYVVVLRDKYQEKVPQSLGPQKGAHDELIHQPQRPQREKNIDQYIGQWEIYNVKTTWNFQGIGPNENSRN